MSSRRRQDAASADWAAASAADIRRARRPKPRDSPRAKEGARAVIVQLERQSLGLIELGWQRVEATPTRRVYRRLSKGPDDDDSHTHEHNHAQLTHSHDYSHADEDAQNGKEAHDHAHPTGAQVPKGE